MNLEQIIALVNAGRFEEAETQFSRITESEGASAQIFAEWARMEVRRGNHEKSLSLIEKSVEIAPGNAEYVFEKGVILFHCGKKSLALLQMDTAVQMEPANPFRYAGRAYIKDGLGDTDGAIADYEIVLKLDPEDAVAHNNLGLLLEKKGWQEKAGQHFKKADNLAEQEKLFSFLDNKTEAETESEIPTTENQKPENSISIMKKVFTDSKTRNEFFNFLKTGLFTKNNS